MCNNKLSKTETCKHMINNRKRNKLFWLSLASAVYLLASQLGLKIFPPNFMEIVDTILLIFTILGVIIDPTTDGILDDTIEQ